MSFRSGFVAVIGRPNVGKTYLINAMVGEQIAITSFQPQTTRQVIRGIVTREHGQIVLVDTPGVHKPKTLLGERLNEMTRAAYSDVDVSMLCFPADEAVGPGDRLLATDIGALRCRKVAVLTKTDKAGKGEIMQRLLALQELATDCGFVWDHIVPVSSMAEENLDALTSVLIECLPEGPALYPDNEVTDASDVDRIRDLIRQAALERVREELPHSIAVEVDEWQVGEGKQRDTIFASLIVERDSQKPILIGKGGAMIKEIGTTARLSLEKLLGKSVHLELKVKVLQEWQKDPKALKRLGFDG